MIDKDTIITLNRQINGKWGANKNPRVYHNIIPLLLIMFNLPNSGMIENVIKLLIYDEHLYVTSASIVTGKGADLKYKSEMFYKFDLNSITSLFIY